MYDPPLYLWAITLTGVAAVPVMTSAVLYSGALRAGLGRRRAALLAGAAAALFGGWFGASAVIAHHGWYHARLGHGVPWMPVAAGAVLVLLLALTRIPAVRQTLAAPGMTSRLELPHVFRVAGIGFLITMALGHLPALFALPAGLGDIAAGIGALFVAPMLARGTGYRAARWVNMFGLADLILALTLGAVTGFQLINITPSAAPITELPLALIPSAEVPLLLALHVIAARADVRRRRAAKAHAGSPGIASPSAGSLTEVPAGPAAVSGSPS